MLNFFSISTIFLILISCINHQSDFKGGGNTLVFIFQNQPDSTCFLTPSGVLVKNSHDYDILYINESGLITGHMLKQGDTIKIYSAQNKHVEIEFIHQSLESLNLLFEANDTVKVIYEKNGLPCFESIGSNSMNKNYNLWNTYLRIPSHLGIDAFSLARSPYMRMINRMKKENSTIFYSEVFLSKRRDFVNIDSLNSLLNTNLRQKIILLDSLYKNNTILTPYYMFYNKIIAEMLKNIENPSYNSDQLFSDSLLFSISYHNKLKGYINSYAKENKIPFIMERNGSYLNFCILFDSIDTKQVKVPPKTKNMLLYYSLEGIAKYFDLEVIEHYGSRYLMLTGDTAKYNILLQQKEIDFTLDDSLLIDDIHGNRYNFSSILAKHRGKVIYLDFWASWCSPCRESMPFAKKLRDEYVKKDIVFLYFALNDRYESWKDAIPKLGLDSNCDNYFITNPRNARILDELKVKSIPRYILFNKKGELVNENAPSLGSKEIKELLDKYLIE